MVRARTRFLEKEYYDFLRKELCSLVEQLHPGVLVDIGCGQGWYTEKLSRYANVTYGFDLSKDAVDHAARNDKNTQYVVGSIFDLPLPDGSVDVITGIFTPVPEQEIIRLLRPGGIFIQVVPGAKHLWELKEQLYDKVYENEKPKDLSEVFSLERDMEIADTKEVQSVWDLFEMTPYRYRSPKAGMEKIRNMTDLPVRFEFEIRIWRKKDEKQADHAGH